MFDQQRFNDLLSAYLDGKISEEDRALLFAMASASGADTLLDRMMDRDLEEGFLPHEKMEPADADRIIRNIIASEENTDLLFRQTRRKTYQRIFAVAAVVVLVLTGWMYFFAYSPSTAGKEDFIALIPKGNVSKVNTTTHPMDVTLEDGTLVRLQPQASISYPGHFSSEREVYLTGEAFFDVAKDPSRPFLVYYNSIVTRVLGTSFTIKTNVKTNNVEVSVRTGRVQVIENSRIQRDKSTPASLKGVILKPNQKTVYDLASRNFEITLADTIYTLVDPSLAAGSPSDAKPSAFFYEKPTSLKDIFNQLETLYGIEIVVTNENIYHCAFTGDISSQEMLKKVQILCLTIGAEFEVNGAKILVSGKGCQ